MMEKDKNGIVFTKQDKEKKDFILVFIHSRYTRDTQALVNLKFTKKEYDGSYDSEIENACSWGDISGDLLVAEYCNISLKEAMSRIHKMFPNADEGIFFYKMVANGNLSVFDYCDELCPECNSQVTIPIDRPSRCPNCGKTILPCGMCNMDKIVCSQDCPFKDY